MCLYFSHSRYGNDINSFIVQGFAQLYIDKLSFLKSSESHVLCLTANNRTLPLPHSPNA